MSSALRLLVPLLLFISPVLSDPVPLSFNDCFDTRRGNTSQKLTVSQIYGQVIAPSSEESYLNLTVIGSTNAEILDTRADGGGNLATLFTTTTILTLSAWSNSSRFCQTLRPPSPLPTPNNSTQLYCPISPGSVAFSTTIPWGRNRALTTLTTRLSAVDPFGEQFLCMDVGTTPLSPDEADTYGQAILIFWVSVALAIAYWLNVGLARIVSAWNRGITRPDKGLWERAQSAGYILASAISGERFAVTPALLRFCTPSMRDVMFHTQWCAVLSMVAVQWPSFIYPLLRQTAWATLTYNITLAGTPHHWNPLSTPPYSPPSEFADQLSNSQSPLFIDTKAPNLLFTLPDNATSGISSFAYSVGIQPEHLFSVCMILFLSIAVVTIGISLVITSIDYFVGFISGLVNGPRHTSRGMKLPGTRSPGFTSRDMLDTVHSPTVDETKSLNGRELGRPSSRLTLNGVTNINERSGPTARRWWKVRAHLSGFHGSVLHGNLVRILILFHLPVTIFSVYQMSLPRSNPNNSLLLTALAGVSFALFSVLFPVILVVRVRLTTTNKLYDETRTLLALGPLYNHYRHGSQMFASMFFATNLAFGLVIGAGQKSGTAQAVVILVVEVISALFTSIWLPWGTGASMGLISFLFCVARIVIAVLLVILTPAISIGTGPAGWVAYGILVILALIYLALALMLVIKILEAFVRLFGGIGFDTSRHVVDSGLLGACGMLGCCGSRRPHRNRNDKAKHRQKNSVHSGRSHPDSEASYAPPTMMAALNTGSDSRKGSLHSGPPPSVLKPEHALRPYREESDDENGFIMGAWQPFQNQSGYIPMKDTPPAPKPTSGFSRVGGGRAHIDTPYAITAGGAQQSDTTFPTTERNPRPTAGLPNQSVSTLPRSALIDDDSPPPSLSSAAVRQQPQQDALPPGAMAPYHIRTKSQTAIIENAGVPMGNRRRNESSSSTNLASTSRPPRFDSAPAPPTAYRHSVAASEDERSSLGQSKKKAWYKFRRNRPHSSEGYRPEDEENVLQPLDVPPPSTTTPGKSFVVIRKGQASPARPPSGT